MTLGLTAYRAAATLVGIAAPLVRGLGSPRTAWRDTFTGASEDLSRAAGSVWVHAASMGEVVAARSWVQALLGAGHCAPLLLTTRTARGLHRARRELGDRVVARVAPLDAPQLLRSFLEGALPWRLDIVETELWPHLVLESRRRGVAVVFVSAAVSERTRSALLRWGLAGPRLLGEGVWVLAQSEQHADRFRSLGVPATRIAVTGDLKAEPPVPAASCDAATRPTVVFGSLRPGEEALAAALARRISEDSARALVVAPRHRDGFERTLVAMREAGVDCLIRREDDRAREDLAAWLDRVAHSLPPRAGILFSEGELPRAYESAAVAIVGGTFAPCGGHNVLEPAARGCPVLVGPHVGAVAQGIEALSREDAVRVLPDAARAEEEVVLLLRSPDRIRLMGRGAARAAAAAAQAAPRSLEALERFGLAP